jgi:hypothetical protein
MSPEEKMKTQVEVNKRYRKKKQEDKEYKAKKNLYAKTFYENNSKKVKKYQQDYQRKIYYPKNRETKNKKIEEVINDIFFPDIIE